MVRASSADRDVTNAADLFLPRKSVHAVLATMSTNAQIAECLKKICADVEQNSGTTGVPKGKQQPIQMLFLETKKLAKGNSILLVALELLWLKITETFQNDYYASNPVAAGAEQSVKETYEKLAKQTKKYIGWMTTALEKPAAQS
jgi:hypothetical protein